MLLLGIFNKPSGIFGEGFLFFIKPLQPAPVRTIFDHNQPVRYISPTIQTSSSILGWLNPFFLSLP
jgi:hypothetical protein